MNKFILLLSLIALATVVAAHEDFPYLVTIEQGKGWIPGVAKMYQKKLLATGFLVHKKYILISADILDELNKDRKTKEIRIGADVEHQEDKHVYKIENLYRCKNNKGGCYKFGLIETTEVINTLPISPFEIGCNANEITRNARILRSEDVLPSYKITAERYIKNSCPLYSGAGLFEGKKLCAIAESCSKGENAQFAFIKPIPAGIKHSFSRFLNKYFEKVDLN